jgi:nicotinate-nucleotide pyrophosphorylase (carboxylating)
MWGLDFGDVDDVIRRALAEDLGTVDWTTEATVPPTARAKAKMLAKGDTVVCGLRVAARTFELVDPQSAFEALVDEGQSVTAGTVIAEIRGSARAILGAERTALNLIQRMAGTATLTRKFADAAEGRCRIVDTRKTTPGLRALQRYAVRCGGGRNHRNDLAAGVLIKENHIRCAGSVGQAVLAARTKAPHSLRVECEVTNLDELREALGAGADVVLLDNMSDDQVREAVEITDRKALIEVSGGITLEQVARLAQLGVDVISIGALTHSAPAADISLLIDISSVEG